jgi:hypothetical protein
MSSYRQLLAPIVLAAALVAAGAHTASAQGAGVRGGVSVDPDQAG